MYSEQQNLLYVALGKEKSTCKGKKVYKSLVFKVFFDALSSAYPLFYAIVKREEFENIVREFMSYGAKSIEMWKMPNEFRKFVKKYKKFRSIAFTDDLLWFEWVEVELMMKNYMLFKPEKFSYKNSYRLSKSAILKKLKYRVFEEGNFEKKETCYLLAYYDFGLYKVFYREISLVMYLFLRELDKKGLKKAINLIAKESAQETKDVKSFFKESLQELVELKILNTN